MLINPLNRDYLRGDIYGGVTAAIVALPLALAFGVASGVGPIAGFYGAICVGFFASLFGGTPTQISGPTGPMTIVMAGVYTQFADNPAIAFTVVMMTGLFQILLGVCKLGRYINLLPYPVLSGFMSGIGCIIIIMQLAPLFGHVSPNSMLSALHELPLFIYTLHWHDCIIGFSALLICYALPKRVNDMVPSSLFALVIGTLLAYFVLTDARILGDIPSGLPSFQMPVFPKQHGWDMLGASLMLALLGAIDTLMTSLIADNLTHTHHDSDKELVGQGIGNAIAGFLGGIPGAGATMRTVINIRSGGHTPLAGVIHAIILLAVVLGLGTLASRIPHAVLAGILVKVGVDIIDWKFLKRSHFAPSEGVIVMFVVLLLTVFFDLITAVSVGMILASIMFVKRMADLQLASIRVVAIEDEDQVLNKEAFALYKNCHEHTAIIHVSGPMAFGVASGLSRAMPLKSKLHFIVLDLTHVPDLDSSVTFAIENMIIRADKKGKKIILSGIQPAVSKIFERLGIFDLLADNQQYPSLHAALEYINSVSR